MVQVGTEKTVVKELKVLFSAMTPIGTDLYVTIKERDIHYVCHVEPYGIPDSHGIVPSKLVCGIGVDSIEWDAKDGTVDVEGLRYQVSFVEETDDIRLLVVDIIDLKGDIMNNEQRLIYTINSHRDILSTYIGRGRLTWISTYSVKLVKDDIDKARTIKGYLMGIRDLSQTVSIELFNAIVEVLECTDEIYWEARSRYKCNPYGLN